MSGKKETKINLYLQDVDLIASLEEQLAEAKVSQAKHLNDIVTDDDLAKVLTETGVNCYAGRLLQMDGGNLIISDTLIIPNQWELDR